MENMLKFEKLIEEAIIPRRAHAGDAGFDIFSPYDQIVPSTIVSGFLVKTGLCMKLPKAPHGMDVLRSIWKDSF